MRLDLRVGMDVGGTNTDAVVLDENNRILARTKQATTSDVRSGMQNALTYVIDALGANALDASCSALLMRQMQFWNGAL
jgi:N-methylhydantoinase A/oxoprolinase/acetone carboxylase beta subunit